MRNLVLLLALLLFGGCASKPDFENYEYSYSRSGGLAPTYENLFITGQNGQYFFEGQNQKYSRTLKLTKVEQNAIAAAVRNNQFHTVREDHQKLYDFVSTTIKVKSSSIRKTDGSGIMPPDQKRWQNVVDVFEKIINDRKLRK